MTFINKTAYWSHNRFYAKVVMERSPWGAVEGLMLEVMNRLAVAIVGRPSQPREWL